MLRLRALGYETADAEGVAQALELATEELLRLSNLDEIPNGMRGLLTERAAERYLLLRGVERITMGDATVERTDVAPDVARFRKVVW